MALQKVEGSPNSNQFKPQTVVERVTPDDERRHYDQLLYKRQLTFLEKDPIQMIHKSGKHDFKEVTDERKERSHFYTIVSDSITQIAKRRLRDEGPQIFPLLTPIPPPKIERQDLTYLPPLLVSHLDFTVSLPFFIPKGQKIEFSHLQITSFMLFGNAPVLNEDSFLANEIKAYLKENSTLPISEDSTLFKRVPTTVPLLFRYAGLADRKTTEEIANVLPDLLLYDGAMRTIYQFFMKHPEFLDRTKERTLSRDVVDEYQHLYTTIQTLRPAKPNKR